MGEGCFGLAEASIRKGVLVRAAANLYCVEVKGIRWIHHGRLVTTTTMKLNLKHLSIRSSNALDAWVENQVLALGEARQIDEANIELAHHADVSPAYEAHVHLVTPGPDLFAEARDHTIRAAFEKVMTELRKGIATRAARPAARARTRRSAPASGRVRINSPTA